MSILGHDPSQILDELRQANQLIRRDIYYILAGLHVEELSGKVQIVLIALHAYRLTQTCI